jgi:hypothetical protein
MAAFGGYYSSARMTARPAAGRGRQRSGRPDGKAPALRRTAPHRRAADRPLTPARQDRQPRGYLTATASAAEPVRRPTPGGPLTKTPRRRHQQPSRPRHPCATATAQMTDSKVSGPGRRADAGAIPASSPSDRRSTRTARPARTGHNAPRPPGNRRTRPARNQPPPSLPRPDSSAAGQHAAPAPHPPAQPHPAAQPRAQPCPAPPPAHSRESFRPATLTHSATPKAPRPATTNQPRTPWPIPPAHPSELIT